MKVFAGPFRATAVPPGSKSLSNRALVLAALAKGTCRLTNILFADDTRVMLDSLARLGFELEIDEPARSVVVRGTTGEIPAGSAELFCGNSGTTIRFLAAMCALGRGSFTLDGVPRMRERPIDELVDVLRALGVRVDYGDRAGYPPVIVRADRIPGGLIKYGSAKSSQFLSAVLMAAPYARHEMHVRLEGAQTSWPYVAMTLRMMDQFGHTPELERDPNTGKPAGIVVPQGVYTATDYQVEPDASNAAYFLAMAAIHPDSTVTVPGLGKQSLQGDVSFVDQLQRMGAKVSMSNDAITVTGPGQLRGIDADMLDMPDQAQTLAVVALFAKGPTTLRGLHTLRMKETDRLTAVATELRKFGAKVTIRADDTLVITPPASFEQILPAVVDTYDDHRMAMSFAVAATGISGITIRNAECVNKTYPEFFEDLEKLRPMQVA